MEKPDPETPPKNVNVSASDPLKDTRPILASPGVSEVVQAMLELQYAQLLRDLETFMTRGQTYLDHLAQWNETDVKVSSSTAFDSRSNPDPDSIQKWAVRLGKYAIGRNM